MRKLFSLLLALTIALAFTPAIAETPALEKDIVVLYTNDVHCAVDSGWGYTGLASYREALLEDGNYVTLVDNGDSIQGEPLGTISRGSYIIDLMNQVQYDVATVGNHEFDYGVDRLMELTEMANFPYVCLNFIDLTANKPVFDAYKIIEYGDVKVAYLGIATPKTFTSSTPTYFQDEDGKFIYSFLQGDNGKELYDAVQASVDLARADGAHYVIAMTHLGIEEECAPWTVGDIITNTAGIDVVLDGHSHSVIAQDIVKNKEGKDVLLSQTGTKLSNIGELRISKDGALSTKLLDWNKSTADAISNIKGQLEETLSEVVAKSDVDLVIFEPDTDPPVRIIRNAETNLGDLCADAYRYISGAEIALVNGGGIRVNINAGDITYNDILLVHPYGNALCMVQATGQQILDALEMASRAVPGENGGFLQVSGLTYEIHTYIESSVTTTDEGMFTGVEGEYRIKNVMVAGEPLELQKTYTVASHNYLLVSGGDGLGMFMDAPLLLEDIMLDNQVLITYITEALGGVVGEGYTDVHGEGRIVAVPEKPAE